MTAPERGACSPTKGSPLLSSWHLAPRLRVPHAGTASEMPSPGVGLQVIHCAQAPLLACQPCRKNLELINSAFRSQQCFPGCSFVARAVLAPAPSASAAADEFPIGKKQKAKKKKTNTTKKHGHIRKQAQGKPLAPLSPAPFVMGGDPTVPPPNHARSLLAPASWAPPEKEGENFKKK